MDKKEFISKAETFVPGRITAVGIVIDDVFPELVRYGLELSGKSYREFSDEIECIPSTVLRWIDGVAKPMPGVKKYVVKLLLKWVQEHGEV